MDRRAATVRISCRVQRHDEEARARQRRRSRDGSSCRVDGRRSGLFGIRSCQTTQRARQRPAPCCQVEPPESAACPPQRNHRRSMEVGETVRPCGNGHCAYPTNHQRRPVRRSAKGARSDGDRAAGTAPRLSSHRPCQLSMWLHFHRTVAEGSAPPLLPVPQQQTSIQRRSYRAMWLSESCGRRYRDRGVGDDRQRVVRT